MKRLVILFAMLAPAFGGDLTQRYQLTLNRILKGGPPRFDDAFVLADAAPRHTRRFTNFSGDVSGRYIGAIASAAAHSGERWPELDRIVMGAIGLQKPDGHFGAPLSQGKVTDADMATLWGNGRMLIGLLEYNRLVKRPEVLASAVKLGEFLLAVAPRFNAEEVRREYNGARFAVGYICWTHNLEGVVELYRQTQDERFLGLARQLAERVDRHPSQHSHGFLCSVRGVVELYRATREAKYLEQAKREWRGVIDSGNLTLPGAVPEMFAPMIKRDEGCSEADWVRLSLDLWRETREPEFLKQAELAFFNEFSSNQFSTGDFGHHVLTADGFTTPAARAWWCCTFHGLRTMVAVLENVFRETDGALLYDLPLDGRGAAGGFAVQAESALQGNGTVLITVLKADGRARHLGFRMPEWATGVSASMGGKPLPLERRGDYLVAGRVWKAGDRITVAYKMRTRVEPDAAAAKASVWHGPWLLGVDMEASPHYFDEPSVSNKATLTDAGGAPALEPAAAGTSARFAVPVARFRFKYLPGGYPMQPATALLRPLAEYTAGPDANTFEYRLPLKPKVERQDSNYNPL